MKTNVCRRLMFAVCFAAGVAAYGQDATGHVNPFLSEFKTPYGVPPFEQITIADYREGFLKGMDATGCIRIFRTKRMQYECRDAGFRAGNGSVAFGTFR